ncbi:hypothetical protein ACLOJK_003477, partial [Asimina triloba]
PPSVAAVSRLARVPDRLFKYRSNLSLPLQPSPQMSYYNQQQPPVGVPPPQGKGILVISNRGPVIRRRGMRRMRIRRRDTHRRGMDTRLKAIRRRDTRRRDTLLTASLRRSSSSRAAGLLSWKDGKICL